ncbi:zinc finger protein 511 [Aplochiton taeniatus]
MLQPELIRLLTEDDLVDTCADGIATFLLEANQNQVTKVHGYCVTNEDIGLPFTFAPQRIHLNKDHELFEDGDIHRHMYLQDLSANTDIDDSPKLSVSAFACHISGCRHVFSSVEDYEHHYNSLHRHVCCSCQRSLPSARLLDIHIQEWHDSLFIILAQRQDMYQCLVEGCGLKFRTSKHRKDHLIGTHKYPPDFRFDKAKKSKKIKETKDHQQRDTSIEEMEAVCESPSVSAVVSNTMPDPPEEGESMELHLSKYPETMILHASNHGLPTVDSVPIEMYTEHSAASSGTMHTNTSQKPRFSNRVPASVCFGHGSVRGFRGRGRRK